MQFTQLLLNLVNLRDLFGVETKFGGVTKLKKNIQEQQPNQFHCYNQSMGFLNRIDQNLARYWHPNDKMMVAPTCLNGRGYYSGCVGILSY